MSVKTNGKVRVLAICLVLTSASLYFINARLTGAQTQTRDHSGVCYVGGAACAECHAKESAA